MPSEYSHIDDFFRKKEQDAKPDLSMQDAHWQQMKQAIGGTQPVAQVKSMQWKLFLQLIAGLAAVIIVILVVSQLGNSGASEKVPDLVVDQTPLQKKSPNIILPAPNSHQQATNIGIPVTQKIGETRLRKVNSQQHAQVPIFGGINPTIDSMTSFDSPADQLLSVNAFFSNLETPTQEYVINSDRDTVIYGRQGTKVYIPARSFKSVDGVTTAGQLIIKLNEFYEIADMVGHKLSTSSNGEMLATGGMLHIEAQQGIDKLVLKTQSSLKIEMPTQRFDPDMQLFYGNKAKPEPQPEQHSTVLKQETINWNPAGQKQFYFNLNNWTIIATDFADDPRDVVSRRGKRIGKFILSDNSSWDIEEFKTELKIRLGMKYDEIKLRRGWKQRRNSARTPLSASLPTVDGIVGEQVRLTLKDARLLGLMSAADSARQQDRWSKQIEKSDSLQRQYLQLREQYTFNITNLGWINCDKFLARSGARTRFVASTGEQFENTYVQSFLIFKDMNSILGGTWVDGNLVFDGVPVGKPVTLVCVGIKNGKAYSSVKETKISPNMLTGLEFEETTPEKFRESLKRFGNVIRG